MTADFSEFSLIAELFAPLAAAPGAFGLKDDAAAIPPRPGHDLVVTTDTVIAGVDFFATDPPELIAGKALRVNLSDLAAKGAVPAFYLLNLSLPGLPERPWLEDFARGLAADQKEFGLTLLGGDTGLTPGPLCISITAFGHVPEGKMIRRNGARPGDGIFVTGTIGDSGGGLAIIKGEGEELSAAHRDHLIARYLLPQPRFDVALRSVASAALDISDGLIADLDHIAQASGVRVAIEAERIPRSPALRALWGETPEAILRAATAGDDYEIAFTATSAPPGCTRIGRVEQGRGVALALAGRPLAVPRPGYRHF
jgi:thiamine-monophosphate kinase